MSDRRTSACSAAELGSFWRPSLTSFALLSVGYLPVALLGVLAVQLEASLVMTPVDIGLAIAAYWGTNAVAAPIVGHRADQHGWAPTGALGVAMSGCVLFLLAAVVGSKPTLMLAMAIAGVGLALCSQSSNLTIAREVPWSRQGRAFGLKQTAPPIIAMASGLIVAGIAVPFGWRWAFLTGAVLALPAAVLMTPYLRQHQSNNAVSRPRDDTPDLSHETTPPHRAIVLIAAGVGCASVSIAALGAFSVPTLVSSGVGASAAATMFAGASAIAVIGRLATGWVADRRGHTSLTGTAIIIGTSAGGVVLLAAPSPAVAAIGLAIALTLGWGWPPVLYPVVMRFWRQATARTTGFVSIGTSAGASVGPVIFGVIVALRGYSAAWVATGVLSLCAAGFLLAAQHTMTGHGPRTPAPAATIEAHE